MAYEFISWTGQSGFLLKLKDKNIYIDPYRLQKTRDHADMILITHPHYDHLSPDDIRKIADSETKIFVPKDSVDKIPVGDAIGVEPDKKYSERGFNFRTVPAYNKVRDRLHFHPRENRWVGYVMDVANSSLYHAGDTDLIDEMVKLNTDLALLPMGGTYTMNVDEAIEATRVILAKNYAPMHYKVQLGFEGARKAEEKFKANVKNAITIKEIEEPHYS